MGLGRVGAGVRLDGVGAGVGPDGVGGELVAVGVGVEVEGFVPGVVTGWSRWPVLPGGRRNVPPVAELTSVNDFTGAAAGLM